MTSLNIVDLITNNPITRLTETHNHNLLNKTRYSFINNIVCSYYIVYAVYIVINNVRWYHYAPAIPLYIFPVSGSI